MATPKGFNITVDKADVKRIYDDLAYIKNGAPRAMSRAITDSRRSTRPRKVWISMTSGTSLAQARNSSKARACVLSSVMRKETSTS